MTGQELWKYTQSLIDKDYSDYVSSVKANRIFKSCLYSLIDKKIESGDSQKLYDEISTLISTEAYVALNNNRTVKRAIDISFIRYPSAGRVYIETRIPHNFYYNALDQEEVVIAGLDQYMTSGWPLSGKLTSTIDSDGTSGLRVTGPNTLEGVFTPIPNANPYLGGGCIYSYDTTYAGDYYQRPFLDRYYRLLSTSVTYKSFTEPVTIYSDGNKMYATTMISGKLRDGDAITTVANSSLKRLSNNKYEVLIDGASYSGSAVAKTSKTGYGVVTKYCSALTSDKKINSLSRSSTWAPMYEDANGCIVYHAGPGVECTSAKIDYIMDPTLFVDVDNNSIDLSLTYQGKFLYALALEFANTFAVISRDEGLYRTSENEIIQNP